MNKKEDPALPKTEKTVSKKKRREIARMFDTQIKDLSDRLNTANNELESCVENKRIEMLLKNSESIKRFRKDLDKKLQLFTLAQKKRDEYEDATYHVLGDSLLGDHCPEDADDSDYDFLFDVDNLVTGFITAIGENFTYTMKDSLSNIVFPVLQDDKTVGDIYKYFLHGRYLDDVSARFSDIVDHFHLDIRRNVENVIKDYIDRFVVSVFDKAQFVGYKGTELNDLKKARDRTQDELVKIKKDKETERIDAEKQTADFMGNSIPKR